MSVTSEESVCVCVLRGESLWGTEAEDESPWSPFSTSLCLCWSYLAHRLVAIGKKAPGTWKVGAEGAVLGFGDKLGRQWDLQLNLASNQAAT